ncbi:helix-turn-helix transcriptional regulator [Parvularcula oceani]|uniref:helix-turn-helix transcriptional regulator n=1 Tax=Parvularcula oceani TaxID=1247963 RepID=UPI0004E16998|nr:helix-turn-helix transcriptional regulator [Parvularcula oceani]
MKGGKSRLRNRVRELRFHAGEMTQAELAERAGVTRQTIAAIEKNRYAPSLETAFLIAEAFRLPIGEVFSFASEGEEG